MAPPQNTHHAPHRLSLPPPSLLPPVILLWRPASGSWPPPAACVREVRRESAGLGVVLPFQRPGAHLLPGCRRRSPLPRAAVRRRPRRRRLGGGTTRGGASVWDAERCPSLQSLFGPRDTRGYREAREYVPISLDRTSQADLSIPPTREDFGGPSAGSRSPVSQRRILRSRSKGWRKTH